MNFHCSGPDSPPSSVNILQDSPFNLTVTWSTPESPNGIIIHYTLYVEYKNGSNVTLRLDPSQMQYVIAGLSPYETVSVNLSASTVIGMGPYFNDTVTTAQTGMR